jgi:hypothetical protein
MTSLGKPIGGPNQTFGGKPSPRPKKTGQGSTLRASFRRLVDILPSGQGSMTRMQMQARIGTLPKEVQPFMTQLMQGVVFRDEMGRLLEFGLQQAFSALMDALVFKDELPLCFGEIIVGDSSVLATKPEDSVTFDFIRGDQADDVEVVDGVLDLSLQARLEIPEYSDKAIEWIWQGIAAGGS